MGAVASLAVVAAVPVLRSDGTLHAASVRVAAAALVVLVVALAVGWSPLVPVAIALAGGSYAIELAADDASLDQLSPVLAAAVLVAAELAYWSLEEREPIEDADGVRARHVVVVVATALAALVVGSLLLVLVDLVQTRGLAYDLLGAVAAVAALVTIAVASRRGA